MSHQLFRLSIVSAALLIAISSGAAAYSGCSQYRYGSHDWWFCISDKDGER